MGSGLPGFQRFLVPSASSLKAFLQYSTWCRFAAADWCDSCKSYCPHVEHRKPYKQQLVLRPLGIHWVLEMFLCSACTLWPILNLHLHVLLLFPPLLLCAAAPTPCVVEQSNSYSGWWTLGATSSLQAFTEPEVCCSLGDAGIQVAKSIIQELQGVNPASVLPSIRIKHTFHYLLQTQIAQHWDK